MKGFCAPTFTLWPACTPRSPTRRVLLSYFCRLRVLRVAIATGSLLSVNPNRMVIKRVLLSGHPYRIYKRLAVLRYLFFNPGLPYFL